MKDLKSILYVAFGACSYGVLATIVKYANDLGIKTSALTFLQFFVGFLVLVLLNRFKKNTEKTEKIKNSSKIKLIIWGTALGLTTTLYYLSIQYMSVSLGIILLMQYSIAIFASSNIESKVPSSIRSQYLVFGGLILIVLFWNVDIIKDIKLSSLPWGILIAIFGTILPPLLFTRGIPKTGIALANIIASLEIPVSIFSAIIILNESVATIQWIGVLIILIAVVSINKKVNSKVF